MAILNCITILNRYELSENVTWVTNLPTQYIFFLVCCLKPDCYHPICKSQNLTNYPTWFSGGPLVSYIPLPIPDPSRPWGRTNCDECKGMCYGHVLKPSEALKSTLTPMASPPSTAIKEALRNLLLILPRIMNWYAMKWRSMYFSPRIKSECGSSTYILSRKIERGVLLVQLLQEE